MKHEEYMKRAIELATIALNNDEVPVGCVIVLNDEIIGEGYNVREQQQTIFTHAENIAINEANKRLNSWRLEDCNLYVTLEPCLMCAGAISQARIKNVYFGAMDIKAGAYGSVIDVSQIHSLNHHTTVYGGLLKEECQQLLKLYFKGKRKQ